MSQTIMTMRAITVLLLVILLSWITHCHSVQKYEKLKDAPSRSFTIDYENNCFLKDGKPFRYVSGSLHYFRVPPASWRDRMLKMRAAGLNALQTYVEWSQHEPSPGTFDFQGSNDVVSFIKTANDVGLLVILRPGPFIDSEREMGGLPYWLLSENRGMKLRTSDESYLSYVDRYFSKLLPLIKPLLYHNGGPIISIQVENEYGSYSACDFAYTAHLKQLYRQYLGEDILLFTTDGSSDQDLMCGKIDGIYSTVDFGAGANITDAFFRQRLHQSSGPLVNSEFYPGWLDHWGEKHANVSKEAVAKALDKMLATNASVNIYMFHGGTSFGFMNGANIDGGIYKPCPTSYDYDAPLSEAGDPTPKYFAIREVIGKYLPLPDMPLPVPSPKMELGPIPMSRIGDFFLMAKYQQDPPYKSTYPIPFEDLQQGYGFLLYTTIIPFQPSDPADLEIIGLADRGYVYVNNIFKGVLSRDQITKMPVIANEGDDLGILVENQGRVSVGDGIRDLKGIIGNVTIGGHVLANWRMFQFFPDWNQATKKILDVAKILKLTAEQSASAPAFYWGYFTLNNNTKTPLDTFLRLDGWHKGVVILNDHILGRYWPIQGPQQTLYAPASFFKPYPEPNYLMVLELQNAPCTPKHKPKACAIKFVKEHVIDGPVPYE